MSPLPRIGSGHAVVTNDELVPLFLHDRRIMSTYPPSYKLHVSHTMIRVTPFRATSEQGFHTFGSFLKCLFRISNLPAGMK